MSQAFVIFSQRIYPNIRVYVIRKNILLVLSAKDFNETEYLSIRNGLQKRGYGLFITSDTNGLCAGNNGLKVKPDVRFYNVHEKNFAALVIVGGYGIRAYYENQPLLRIVERFNADKKIIGAICAAPIILSNAGILSGRKGTCFYDDKDMLIKGGAVYSEDKVVCDGNIITGNSSSASSEFIERLVESLGK